MHTTSTGAARDSPEIAHRKDLAALTPDRLADSVDYAVFERLHGRTHRGQTVDVDRLLSFCSAALTNAAVAGDRRRGSGEDLSIHEAVGAIQDAFEARHPAWFGDRQALRELDQPHSNVHLNADAIRDRFYGGELFLNGVVVDTWTSHLTVAAPLVALTLADLEAQIEADRERRIEIGKAEIRMGLVSNAFEYDLSDDDLREVVERTLDELADRRDR